MSSPRICLLRPHSCGICPHSIVKATINREYTATSLLRQMTNQPHQSHPLKSIIVLQDTLLKII